MIREETISLGSIVKIHGLKGDFLLSADFDLDRIKLETEWVFFDYQGQLIPFSVENIEITGSSTILLKVEDIDSINQANEWLGKKVYLPSDSIKKTKKAEKESLSLLGYSVKDAIHGQIGTVAEILELKDNPLIRVMNQGKEILIPLSDSIIVKIDKKKLVLEISAPEGLIDLYLE